MQSYKDKSPEWREGLRNYLLKAEIEYVAKNGGSEIYYLQGFLGRMGAMKEFLVSIGFRIKRDFKVEENLWIETTNGITICLNDGFCWKTGGNK